MAMLITQERLKKEFYNKAFREHFSRYEEEFKRFFNNPGCACNGVLYRAIASDVEFLKQWFAQDIELDPILTDITAQKQEWTVINTTIDKLEEILNGLTLGPKTFAVARHQDQVTVIIRDLSGDY